MNNIHSVGVQVESIQDESEETHEIDLQLDKDMSVNGSCNYVHVKGLTRADLTQLRDQLTRYLRATK